MKKNENYERCCAYCEKAHATDDPEMFFCLKKKKDVHGGEQCRAFSYDLLKRVPVHMAVPGIDPNSVL